MSKVINDWGNAVKIAQPALDQSGRATAFEFTGAGGQQTWMGAVSLQPNAKTGAHHHGRHEVAVYVVNGRGRIRWGDDLEFSAEIGSGDFIYFTPYVPHQELNLDADRTLDFVVVRSDGERIAVNLDIVAPERSAQLGGFAAAPK
jgi:uncharacterized RmlC-like cupin family protein